MALLRRDIDLPDGLAGRLGLDDGFRRLGDRFRWRFWDLLGS